MKGIDHKISKSIKDKNITIFRLGNVRRVKDLLSYFGLSQTNAIVDEKVFEKYFTSILRVAPQFLQF